MTDKGNVSFFSKMGSLERGAKGLSVVVLSELSHKISPVLDTLGKFKAIKANPVADSAYKCVETLLNNLSTRESKLSQQRTVDVGSEKEQTLPPSRTMGA